MKKEELIKKYKNKIAELQRTRDNFDSRGLAGACIGVTCEIQVYNAVIKDLFTLPDEINYKQKYEEIVNSDWFKKAYENRPIGDAITLPDEKEYCKCKDLNAVNRICRRCKKIVPIRQYERSKSNQP